MNWQHRLGTTLVGCAVLATYTAAAVLSVWVLRWLFENPPRPAVAVVLLLLVALGSAYFAHQMGIVRLTTRLEASELSPRDVPGVYSRMQRLCDRMALPQPRLLVADFETPNALSLGGPRSGTVVIDRRLLSVLQPSELEAVIAHELAHIERYDSLLNTIVLTMLRVAVALFVVPLVPVLFFLTGIDRSAHWFVGPSQDPPLALSRSFRRVVEFILTVLFSPITVLYLAHSRRQEYRADQRAAQVTGNPLALARALVTIERVSEPHRGLRALLYTHDDSRERQHELLSTHPPVEKRVGRLLRTRTSQ